MKVTSLGDRPFVVLVADETIIATNDWSKLEREAWFETGEALAKLSTRGRMEVVQDANHLSVVFSSRVDFAVEEVYKAVTQGGK